MIKIEITGADAQETISQLKALAGGFGGTASAGSTSAATKETKAATTEKEPVKEKVKGPSLDDVRDALADIPLPANRQKIATRYAAKLSEIDPADYAKVIADVKEFLAD